MVDLKDIGNQLLFTTVPIWTEKGGGRAEIATGFFYMHGAEDATSVPVILTNRHVVENSVRGFISLTHGEGGTPNSQQHTTVEFDGKFLQRFLHSEYDLAVIPVGPILNEMKNRKQEVFFRSISKELIPTEKVSGDFSAIEEVTFIGYPSGLYDRQTNTPIIRRGISASPIWNDFEGTPTFLIDAGVYPGSSGSPVFIYNRGTYPTPGGIAVGNRILFLGIVYGTIQAIEDGKQGSFIGIGRVLKSSAVERYVSEVIKDLTGKRQ